MYSYNAGASSFTSPYRFNGKEKDPETGYHYYGARYYQSKFSVWMSVDPLVHETLEPYVYTGNNPVMLVDPDGKRPTITGIDPPDEKRKKTLDIGNEEQFENLLNTVDIIASATNSPSNSQANVGVPGSILSIGIMGTIAADMAGATIAGAIAVVTSPVGLVIIGTIAVAAIAYGIYKFARGRNGHNQRGERGETAKPSGTNNPNKKLKNTRRKGSEPNPGKKWDKRTGKWRADPNARQGIPEEQLPPIAKPKGKKSK
jgi:RHS repeat-associated protein